MLTVQILTRNNEDTIEKTLKSLNNLKANIVVGDLGSSDRTIEICEKHGAEVVELKWENDYSKARNQLIKEGMNFYIEPWEIILKGHEIINNCDNNLGIYVIENEIVSKEIRIWKNLKFKNPIYETLIDENAIYTPNVVIISKRKIDENLKEKTNICKNWLDVNPTKSEPYYYMACCSLANRNYKDFLNFAEKYISIEGNYGKPAVALNYYISQVELHIGNDIQKALKKVLSCVLLFPTFAEYWCLLGDIFYKKQKYEKAMEMYKNAIIIGKRRLNSDSYPIEIKKYNEYPEKMKFNCISILLEKNNTLEKLKK